QHRGSGGHGPRATGTSLADAPFVHPHTYPVGRHRVDELQIHSVGEQVRVVSRLPGEIQPGDVLIGERTEMRIPHVHGDAGEVTSTHSGHRGPRDAGRAHLDGTAAVRVR